jgi:hypothetical protein
VFGQGSTLLLPVDDAEHFFLRPEDRLAIGEGDAHPLADRVRFFARERENVGQEGFVSPIGFPPWRLRASPMRFSRGM